MTSKWSRLFLTLIASIMIATVISGLIPSTTRAAGEVKVVFMKQQFQWVIGIGFLGGPTIGFDPATIRELSVTGRNQYGNRTTWSAWSGKYTYVKVEKLDPWWWNAQTGLFLEFKLQREPWQPFGGEEGWRSCFVQDKTGSAVGNKYNYWDGWLVITYKGNNTCKIGY